ncbi:hypothetical protein J2T09_002325 [Neorhizobium huautlense]|uniref:Uncharacterized protein n=1 Tax=Neorhizobium huautlense TaxID=67774 RepID=A0ABT9PTY8_9HYPH|nr:hypothetical protein [Neorhizobium huautlense]MDP9837573.1 hypothetical protein [Neorhizobium huautlense]
MADVLRFPARKPALTLAVDNTVSAMDVHELRRLNELEHTANYLKAALIRIDMELHGLCLPQEGIRKASPSIKAALFHVLTLDGCREKDRALRNMLAAEDDAQDSEASR